MIALDILDDSDVGIESWNIVLLLGIVPFSRSFSEPILVVAVFLL